MDHDLIDTHIPDDLALAVYSSLPCQQSEALAHSLDVDLVQDNNILHQNYQYYLEYQNDRLCLQKTGKKAPGPIAVDFAGASSEYRRTKGGGELIGKAVGGDKKARPFVLDVTAGLGRDSFVLASKGYKVAMIERSPIIAALLSDGLLRLSKLEDPELVQIAERLSFVNSDAIDFLKQLPESQWPQVIYIDPMFPVSKKTAMVKKEMRAFHDVVGISADDSELLNLALERVINRVVVKRPLKAEPLAGREPQLSMKGKAIRFDIYTVKRFD